MKICTIIGPMGSGKSATLIEVINSITSFDTDGKFLVFKPNLDTRTPGIISSRNGSKYDANEIDSFKDILLEINDQDIKYIFIDELQFIDLDGLRDLIIECYRKDISIVASGLDLTSELEVFETTSKFICYSTDVYKIYGDCNCGDKSIFTMFRGTNKDGQVKIGDSEYIGVCPECHDII